MNNFKKLVVGGGTVITYKQFYDNYKEKESQKKYDEALNNLKEENKNTLEGLMEENTINKLTALELQFEEKFNNINKEIKLLNKTSLENKTTFEYNQNELEKHLKSGDEI